MSAGAPAAEVAVVPDFSSPGFATLFEARTLFFLASWLERFGEADPERGELTPRLCCVGEPPESVRRLAARVGAEITLHAPVPGFWGGFANKLRGLEGGAPGRPRWLLDADVLVLGRLETLGNVRSDFAAAAAGKPQVPHALWELIYASLGVPLPEERMPSLRGRFGLGWQAVNYRYAGQQEEAGAMLPYYNSGVLFVGADGGLRLRWEEHMRRVLRLAEGRPEMAPIHAVIYGDQVGLATALQSLRAEGRTFERLPDACNARLVHLRAGALRWDEIQLFHATGFLRGLRDRADLASALESYVRRWSEAIREGHRADAPAASDGEDGERPRRFLETLWERWVRPEWEARPR